MSDYPAFGKIPRLRREVIVTEKIDGTNGLVSIVKAEGIYLNEGETLSSIPGVGSVIVRAGSRNRWLTKASDNYGFARWVEEHADELATLGLGNHYGEWYGAGIQRRYGMDHKRFALFNSSRWTGSDQLPSVCEVVPVVAAGGFDAAVDAALLRLRTEGSVAVPGFMQPEGVVVWHTASRSYFKVLLEGDDHAKGAA